MTQFCYFESVCILMNFLLKIYVNNSYDISDLILLNLSPDKRMLLCPLPPYSWVCPNPHNIRSKKAKATEDHFLFGKKTFLQS